MYKCLFLKPPSLKPLTHPLVTIWGSETRKKAWSRCLPPPITPQPETQNASKPSKTAKTWFQAPFIKYVLQKDPPPDQAWKRVGPPVQGWEKKSSSQYIRVNISILLYCECATLIWVRTRRAGRYALSNFATDRLIAFTSCFMLGGQIQTLLWDRGSSVLPDARDKLVTFPMFW